MCGVMESTAVLMFLMVVAVVIPVIVLGLILVNMFLNDEEDAKRD